MDSIDRMKREIISMCRHCRRKHQITQRRLSEVTGVNLSVFSRFENGWFSFEVARHYYKHIMNVCEAEEFEVRIEALKEEYLR